MYKYQKLTLAKRLVHNEPLKRVEQDNHTRLPPTSTCSFHPLPLSPLHVTNQDSSSSTTYKIMSSDKEEKDIHGLIRPRQTDHQDCSELSIADLYSRQLKVPSLSPHPSLSSHSRIDHSNVGHQSAFSHPKTMKKLNISNTDSTPHGRLRKLSDIYQELDKLDSIILGPNGGNKECVRIGTRRLESIKLNKMK